MACWLVSAKLLSKPKLAYSKLNPKEQNSVKISRNSNIFIMENDSLFVLASMC